MSGRLHTISVQTWMLEWAVENDPKQRSTGYAYLKELLAETVSELKASNGGVDRKKLWHSVSATGQNKNSWAISAERKKSLDRDHEKCLKTGGFVGVTLCYGTKEVYRIVYNPATPVPKSCPHNGDEMYIIHPSHYEQLPVTNEHDKARTVSVLGA